MTMRRLLWPLLLCSLPALADDKPWPQKGDTVYVAVPMKMQFPAMPFSSAQSMSIARCAPLRVLKVKGDGGVNLKDDAGIEWWLGPSMQPVLHRSVESCTDVSGAPPGARAVRDGHRIELVVEPGLAAQP
jgi:hypothetical protein